MIATDAIDRWLGTVARAAVLGALASPAIVIHDAYFPHTVGRAVAFERFADIAVIAWMILLARGRLELRATTTTLLLLAFAGWVVITALLGAHPERSFGSTLERGEGALSWLRVALLLAATEGVFADADSRRRLCAGAALAAVVTIGANMLTAPGPWRFPGTAFGNHGLLADYLLGAAPLALLVACDREADRRVRAAAAAGAAILIAATAATGSRAALLALAAGMVAAATFNRTRVRLVLAAIALATLGIVLRSEGADPRGIAWAAAFAGIADRPLLGWGVENFNLAFDLHGAGAPAEPFFDRAHSALIDWAIAGGVAGAALRLAPVVVGFRDAFRLRRDGDPLRAAVIGGALTAKLVFGAFWFEQPVTLLLLGLLLMQHGTVRSLPSRIAVPAHAWRAPTVMVSVGAVLLAAQSLTLVGHARQIGAAMRLHDRAGGPSTLPAVTGASFAVRQDVRLLAGGMLLKDIRDHGRIPSTREREAILDQIRDFETHAPLDSRGPLLAALLYAATGMPEHAAESRDAARRLAPRSPLLETKPERIAER